MLRFTFVSIPSVTPAIMYMRELTLRKDLYFSKSGTSIHVDSRFSVRSVPLG
ncbi:hypothetical protein D3C87_2075950 [compost metagenome]